MVEMTAVCDCVVTWLHRRVVGVAAEHRESVGPDRDEASIELLRTDPARYFDETRRCL